jgi:HPt (histidine-containing phosphotransfer) domain-containing protein
MLPPQQLRELYQLTIDDVQQRLERMAAALAQGNFAECRAEAHAIKGSCGMVGAAELNALAAQMEAAPEAGKPPLADFAAACTRLQRMLDQRF